MYDLVLIHTRFYDNELAWVPTVTWQHLWEYGEPAAPGTPPRQGQGGELLGGVECSI